MNVDEELAAAVEGLYVAFAHCRLPPKIDYCDCCHDETCVTRLRSPPVREMPQDGADHFRFTAITTFGGPAEFRYVLPRMLETAERGDISRECQRLALSEWRSWSQREQDAVRRYLRAWWCRYLSSTDLMHDPRRGLENIASADEELDWYTAKWAELTAALVREANTAECTAISEFLCGELWTRRAKCEDDRLTAVFREFALRDETVLGLLRAAERCPADERTWIECALSAIDRENHDARTGAT